MAIDLVWSEELVDKRVIGSVRKYNRKCLDIECTLDAVDSLTCSCHRDHRILERQQVDF